MEWSNLMSWADEKDETPKGEKKRWALNCERHQREELDENE